MDKEDGKQRPRILVIDDDPGICLAISLLIQDQYEIVTAETVEDGLARLDEPFALILLDLRMPGVSGYDLLETVRARVPNTPVAVLSATGGRRTTEDVLGRGATSLIEKPFSGQELLAIIRQILTDTGDA